MSLSENNQNKQQILAAIVKPQFKHTEAGFLSVCLLDP